MDKAKIDQSLQLVGVLYQFCPVGGYGHIVFDDGNLEDHQIDFCLKMLQEDPFEHFKEPGMLEAEKEALEYFKTLTMEEREAVYAQYS